MVPETTVLGDSSQINGHIHAHDLEDMTNGLGSMDTGNTNPTSKAVSTTLAILCGLLNFIILFVKKFLADGEYCYYCRINGHEQCAETA